MDLRRVRVWEWLTGLAGAALLVSLFLPWYGRSGGHATGWQALSVTDVILALIALAAMSLVAVTAFQRTAAVPQAMVAFLVALGLIAAIVALVKLLDLPDSPLPGVDTTRQAGVWIGAASALAILVFAWRSMGDKRFPRSMRPLLEIPTIPAPMPDGERRDLQ